MKQCGDANITALCQSVSAYRYHILYEISIVEFHSFLSSVLPQSVPFIMSLTRPTVYNACIAPGIWNLSFTAVHLVFWNNQRYNFRSNTTVHFVWLNYTFRSSSGYCVEITEINFKKAHKNIWHFVSSDNYKSLIIVIFLIDSIVVATGCCFVFCKIVSY